MNVKNNCIVAISRPTTCTLTSQSRFERLVLVSAGNANVSFSEVHVLGLELQYLMPMIRGHICRMF